MALLLLLLFRFSYCVVVSVRCRLGALFYGTREGSVFRDDLREDPRLSAAVLRSGDSMGAITSLRTHPVEGFGT